MPKQLEIHASRFEVEQAVKPKDFLDVDTEHTVVLSGRDHMNAVLGLKVYARYFGQYGHSKENQELKNLIQKIEDAPKTFAAIK